ncbi:hypothetical protein [Lysobacter sp. CA199]|uniref:hypothetical protein n=1 Tax=Lysobacter sp. CA199 TaxID=3455608 RepID=UPI003F8D4F20
MSQLTVASKKQITADWGRIFPSLVEYKPLQLVRRIGPYVQGISLDRRTGNDVYVPTTFLHSLCSPAENLSLSLSQPLLSERAGLPKPIKVAFHAAHLEEAAAKLRNASVLPLAGDITLDELFTAYARHRTVSLLESKYPIHLMMDAVSAAAWLGDGSRASARARLYLEEAKTWPDNILAREGGYAAWSDTLNRIAGSTDELREVVNDQIKRLGLEKIPASDLLF